MEDYLVDWSILQPGVKHKGLWAELIYNDHIPVEYFVFLPLNLIESFSEGVLSGHCEYCYMPFEGSVHW